MMMAASTHTGTAIAQKMIQSTTASQNLPRFDAPAEPEQEMKQAHVSLSWSSERLATRSVLLRCPGSSVAA